MQTDSSLEPRVLTVELEQKHMLRRLDQLEKRADDLQSAHNSVMDRINKSILWAAMAAIAMLVNIVRGKIGL